MTYGMGDAMPFRGCSTSGELTDRQRRIERQKIEALLGYCEAVSCRRTGPARLLWRDRSPALRQLRQLLSPCPELGRHDRRPKRRYPPIYRTGQRFGARHLVDVLLGAETERIVRLSTDRLKTFGVGTELDRRGWVSVYRQLVAQGLLMPIRRSWRAFSWPRRGGDIARQQSVRLRQESWPRPRERQGPDRRGRPSSMMRHRLLWEALRAWRLGRGAPASKFPPYVIFHNSTLTESPAAARLSPDGLGADPGHWAQQARTLWRCRHRNCRRRSRTAPHMTAAARTAGAGDEPVP